MKFNDKKYAIYKFYYKNKNQNLKKKNGIINVSLPEKIAWTALPFTWYLLLVLSFSHFISRAVAVNKRFLAHCVIRENKTAFLRTVSTWNIVNTS